MRRTNEEPIKNVLKDFFKSYHLEARLHEAAIKEMWEKVMGKTMARYTSDVRLRESTLTIYINSAPLKQELMFNKENIISRLNEEFGETVVKEIVIR